MGLAEVGWVWAMALAVVASRSPVVVIVPPENEPETMPPMKAKVESEIDRPFGVVGVALEPFGVV